jgi:hypothetical protein
LALERFVEAPRIKLEEEVVPTERSDRHAERK